jgi:hypothetical protein
MTRAGTAGVRNNVPAPGAGLVTQEFGLIPRLEGYKCKRSSGVGPASGSTSLRESAGLAGGVPQKGKLVQVSDGGVLLQMEKGQTFFPVTAILHISLLDEY